MASPENKQPDVYYNAIKINRPSAFSWKALREIARFQIYRNQPTKIQIKQNAAIRDIASEELTNARLLFSRNRGEYLNTLATLMQKADQIVIISAATNKTEQKTGNSSQYSAAKKFIENSPLFTQLDNWKH